MVSSVCSKVRPTCLESNDYRKFSCTEPAIAGARRARCGLYESNGESRRLEPGMVLTVERTLHRRGRASARRLSALGVRIEDDVLVTAGSHDVLTSTVPKSLRDIEGLRPRRRPITRLKRPRTCNSRPKGNGDDDEKRTSRSRKLRNCCPR